MCNNCKCGEEIEVKVIYHDPNMPRLEKLEKGNWIDLRAIESGKITRNGEKFKAKWGTEVKVVDGVETPVRVLKYKAGDFIMINLGITIAQPLGYEVRIVPRSSTFKNFGLIQVNSMGIGDDTFRGDDDVYQMPCYALRDGQIELYDRVCQFRLEKVMPPLNIKEVETTGYKNRSGFGSSGVK